MSMAPKMCCMFWVFFKLQVWSLRCKVHIWMYGKVVHFYQSLFLKKERVIWDQFPWWCWSVQLPCLQKRGMRSNKSAFEMSELSEFAAPQASLEGIGNQNITAWSSRMWAMGSCRRYDNSWKRKKNLQKLISKIGSMRMDFPLQKVTWPKFSVEDTDRCSSGFILLLRLGGTFLSPFWRCSVFKQNQVVCLAHSSLFQHLLCNRGPTFSDEESAEEQLFLSALVLSDQNILSFLHTWFLLQPSSG